LPVIILTISGEASSRLAAAGPGREAEAVRPVAPPCWRPVTGGVICLATAERIWCPPC